MAVSFVMEHVLLFSFLLLVNKLMAIFIYTVSTRLYIHSSFDSVTSWPRLAGEAPILGPHLS